MQSIIRNSLLTAVLTATVIVATTSPISAANSAKLSPASAAHSYGIGGSVIGAQSGAPLAGLTVLLRDSSGCTLAMSSTDANGRYFLSYTTHKTIAIVVIVGIAAPCGNQMGTSQLPPRTAVELDFAVPGE